MKIEISEEMIGLNKSKALNKKETVSEQRHESDESSTESNKFSIRPNQRRMHHMLELIMRFDDAC